MKSSRLKILTIQFKSLGDAVLSVPSLMAIRQRFPDCELHALVTEMAAPLLQHHPAVNRVWAVPRKRAKTGLKELRPFLRALRALRAERFDRSVDFAGNDRGAITSLLCGAPERLGVVMQNGFWGRRFCYTTKIDRGSLEIPESLRLLRILSPWGISPPANLEIKLYPDPKLSSPFSCDSSKPTVICNIGAACSKKVWPVPHWVRLHEMAVARGYDLWYTRGVFKMDEQLIRDLEVLAPGAKILPKLDLPNLLVALKSADAVISNDTGPMHFAAGLGVKTIAIFGPSSSQRWGPIGPGTRILATTGCICQRDTYVCRRAKHCLEEITPESV